jgi:hypothetical protein
MTSGGRSGCREDRVGDLEGRARWARSQGGVHGSARTAGSKAHLLGETAVGLRVLRRNASFEGGRQKTTRHVGNPWTCWS